MTQATLNQLMKRASASLTTIGFFLVLARIIPAVRRLRLLFSSIHGAPAGDGGGLPRLRWLIGLSHRESRRTVSASPVTHSRSPRCSSRDPWIGLRVRITRSAWVMGGGAERRLRSPTTWAGLSSAALVGSGRRKSGWRPSPRSTASSGLMLFIAIGGDAWTLRGLSATFRLGAAHAGSADQLPPRPALLRSSTRSSPVPSRSWHP